MKFCLEKYRKLMQCSAVQPASQSSQLFSYEVDVNSPYNKNKKLLLFNCHIHTYTQNTYTQNTYTQNTRNSFRADMSYPKVPSSTTCPKVSLLYSSPVSSRPGAMQDSSSIVSISPEAVPIGSVPLVPLVPYSGYVIESIFSRTHQCGSQ